MGRLGYKCDECGNEHRHVGPAGVVKIHGRWHELCSGCYAAFERGELDA